MSLSPLFLGRDEACAAAVGCTMADVVGSREKSASRSRPKIASFESRSVADIIGGMCVVCSLSGSPTPCKPSRNTK